MPTCPNCGTDNPEHAKFCLECATPLTEGAPARSAEERKVVTVLFCDLVGFTSRSDNADPEDVRATVRPYYARLREEIERYGGTVEKFIGDAVMAVFGAPVAHEDDAERAVRAGLRILEAIGDLNEEGGLGLAVRIGINTGEAVVALGARPEHGEGIVTGDVVNTASRLQSAAPAGGIVVGEATYQATARIVNYTALEPVELKGKAEPVPIWQATSARARFGTDLTQRHAAKLVGRNVEKTLLQSLFERSVRDSSVQLVTIVGEPGVGKSRIVAEFGAYIDARPELITWRQGRCLPYGDGITFWALGEIVKAHAGILESDSPAEAAAKLDAVIPIDEQDRQWLKARLGPLVGVEPDAGTTDREESFTAWGRFLQGIAWEDPAVFVFEDLHWADPAMLEFLGHVAEWAEGVPMLLVCTARPELHELHPGWAGGTRNATTIELSPLGPADTARLVSELLEQAVLPADVQRAILERAGGNPLYAEEFVRMLKDRGLLVRRGRTWELAPDAEIPFPESIQALIAARLDTLAPDRKALLQDAAVLGKVFWSGAVATMGGIDERVVRDALHELSRKELVRPARVSSMEGEAEYAFWHVLVRDVCYGQIPRAARAAKHEAAATWIEERAGERLEDLADVVAYHYTEALELATAAGGTDDTAALRDAARRSLVLAGERALNLDAGHSLVLYGRALELATPDEPGRPEILLRFGVAAKQAGSNAQAISLLEDAVALFRARGDQLGEARAMLELETVLYYAGRPGSEQVLRKAVSLLEGLPLGPDLVEGYRHLAADSYVRGLYRDALAWYERAISLAADLRIEPGPGLLAGMGVTRCFLGERDGAEDVRRAIDRALNLGSGYEAAIACNNLGVAIYQFDGPAAALAQFDAAVELAERRGIAAIVTFAGVSALDPLYDLAEWDDLLERGEDLVLRVISSLTSTVGVRS